MDLKQIFIFFFTVSVHIKFFTAVIKANAISEVSAECWHKCSWENFTKSSV